MIISLRSISYGELKERLDKKEGVVLWSCDECIKHCGFGGMEKMCLLEALLEHDGYTVLKKELISRSCFMNLVAKRRDALSEASAIIVLSCELGYKCVKTVFKDKNVVNTARTLGVGNFTTFRGPVLTSPLPWTRLEPDLNGYTLKTLSNKLGLYSTFFEAVDEELVEITVDGKPFQAKEGANLLDSLLKLGVRIPHLCYDPSLESIGSCRLCLVKIRGKPLPSCCMEVSEGMEIVVNDDELEEMRRLLLEFIIAENGIEVLKRSMELRYWTRKYKVAETRFELKAKEWQVDDSSEVMVIDPSLCVLCGRCVVACNNVSGQHVIDFANRGSDTQMITGLNERFNETNCASCMACANYCPTEAIAPKLLFKKLAKEHEPLKPTAPPLVASSTR